MLFRIPFYDIIKRSVETGFENTKISTNDYEDYETSELEGKGLILYY